MRSLFNHFPLRVYGPEPLPVRAPAHHPSGRPALYVFAGDLDAARGRPSFNPSCLKWQTVLRIAGVDVELVPSNNHASPSGALPFLLPAAAAPLTGDKIYQYAKEHAQHSIKPPSVPTPRLEIYEALLTQNIRPAWVCSLTFCSELLQLTRLTQLHALYLLPANDSLLQTLYLTPGILLRHPLRTALHAAATEQILTTTHRAHIDPTLLLADLTAALQSLCTLLGDDDWFFGADAPGVFDAEVFAYTWLILDERLEWRDRRLAECLAGFGNLVEHRRRLYERCWGEETNAEK